MSRKPRIAIAAVRCSLVLVAIYFLNTSIVAAERATVSVPLVGALPMHDL